MIVCTYPRDIPDMDPPACWRISYHGTRGYGLEVYFEDEDDQSLFGCSDGIAWPTQALAKQWAALCDVEYRIAYGTASSEENETFYAKQSALMRTRA